MPSGLALIGDAGQLAALADDLLRALRKVASREELAALMTCLASEIGFRHFALIHHVPLAGERPDRVDIRDYPAAIVDRLFDQGQLRRDPVIRGCLFSDGAFLWSDLDKIITFTRQDRHSLEFGAGHGLNEGITVPHVLLGECIGSCTFAGATDPQLASRYLGFAQITGIFAFQAARRMLLASPLIGPAPRLHPRPRDCVVLAGRGFSNKEIARELGLTPRTVDGYLTEARRLFDAHDRAELVVSAVLAGEIGLDELKPRQTE